MHLNIDLLTIGEYTFYSTMTTTLILTMLKAFTGILLSNVIN